MIACRNVLIVTHMFAMHVQKQIKVMLDIVVTHVQLCLPVNAGIGWSRWMMKCIRAKVVAV